jgi:hypothetical protein
MAFGLQTRHAKYARNYEECAAFFDKPLGTRAKAWYENMRPLDNLRKPHMYVLRGKDYYDVVLYSTSMARYYKPEQIGTSEQREVWYNVHGSQSSSSFQWDVLGFGAANYTRKTTHGKEVLIGMNPEKSGLVFPVQLRLVDNLLYVAKSRDCPARLGDITSPQRKADRKAFKLWLRPFEAMSKVMEPGAVYVNWDTIRNAYITNELFDPTGLACYIKQNGAKAAVDKVYPLGDVPQYNESFKEMP